ncbi:MAG: aminoacyl-tRNA hydrolase [Anaerolineales bacterium]|nr:aminoacyl-tRNA hydrolase [Anaerolineales bacterium]
MTLYINDRISIDESELQFEFIHASGPGGQNINKLASAVQLRFDVLHSPSLPDEVRLRLIKLAGRRINNQGVLVIEARQRRSQEQNKQDAVQRLTDMLQAASQPPKPRYKTKPTQASRQHRLDSKRRRSQIKFLRQKYHSGEE